MKNTRNSRNNNMKYINRRKQCLLNRNIIMLFSTLVLVMTLLCTVGITAIAKEDKPLYKYYQSYMVEKGDTLLSIAYDMNADECSDKQIKECVNEMISINSLDHKGTIGYGNYIIVPYYSTEYR